MSHQSEIEKSLKESEKDTINEANPLETNENNDKDKSEIVEQNHTLLNNLEKSVSEPLKDEVTEKCVIDNDEEIPKDKDEEDKANSSSIKNEGQNVSDEDEDDDDDAVQLWNFKDDDSDD